MCNTKEVETVYHVIVECTKYKRERSGPKPVVSDDWLGDEWGGEFFTKWTGMSVERMG